MANHLIHIGYPKTASTFLQEWFRVHPQFHFSNGHLAGFQNVYSISSRAAETNTLSFQYYVTSYESFSYPINSYGSYIANFGISEEKNIKQKQKKTCTILKEIFPNSTILIITRGFEEMLHSGYSQYIKVGGLMSFSDFAIHNKKNIVDDLNYDYVIKLYRENFGHDNVIVLPFEMLRENQSRFLRHLEDTLGLNYVDLNIKKLNKSLSGQQLYWYLKLSQSVATVLSMFGNRIYKIMYPKYVQLLFRKKVGKSLTAITNLLPKKNLSRKVEEEFFFPSGTQPAELKKISAFKPYLSEYSYDSEISSSQLEVKK